MNPKIRLLADRYQVGKLIGHGGMSDVHLGKDVVLERTVAIKLLKPELSQDASFRARFRHEAQSVARMNHPTIVRIFDAGEETVTDPSGKTFKLPFIVMEYIEGKLLKDIIKGKPLPIAEALRISEEVLTALEHSHRANIVHRDIKSSNIMITPSGEVKVMDFGIARAVSESLTTLAQTASILGTANYFSPEQARGETVDFRSDLYSTGVVLFEMVTGRTPFTDENPVTVAYQHVTEPPVAPSSLNPDVPQYLDHIVAYALRKRRTDRYQNAFDFKTDIINIKTGNTPQYSANAVSEDPHFSDSIPVAINPQVALHELSRRNLPSRTQKKPPTAVIWTVITLSIIFIISIITFLLNFLSGPNLPDFARKVPDFSGKTTEYATNTLEGMELNVIHISEPSEDIPEHQVIRTQPPAGIIVGANDSVTVISSSGKPSALLPQVNGLPFEEAKQKLEEAGFVAGPTTRTNSPTVAENIVISVTPPEQTSAPFGSTVSFTVSTGNVTLPDLIGSPIQNAENTLRDLSLTPILTPDTNCQQQQTVPIVRTQSLPPGDIPQKSSIQMSYCSRQ